MSAQQIFYIIGIVYFSFWLLVGIGFLIFSLVFVNQIKRNYHKIENKLGAAKVLLNLAQSSFVRKVVLFIGSISFVTKTVSKLLSSSDQDQT